MSARDRKAAYSRESSGEERKIGQLRPVANPRRRKKAEISVESWALTYLRGWFTLKVSQAHKDLAQLLQSIMEEGGLGALAISRGFGKTTWTMAAVLWALASGRRKYVVVLCATDKLAEKIVKKIKAELETNDLLNEDYPEITQAVRALERITRRAFGQIWNDGTPTRIEWNAGGITLPMAYRKVKGKSVPTPSSGGIIHTVPITGAVRGLSATGPEGEILRPDVVVLDDVQTRGSAKSPTQTADLEAIICDDVLGLAGPTTSIAAALLVTPIYANDLPERFLDADRHPEWDGRRVSMLSAMPTRMDLWEQYRDLRKDGQRAGDKGRSATKFYRENQSAMDAGAVVTWPERKKPGEVTGLQSAMNIWADNPRGFAAEYQCRPKVDGLAAGAKELIPAEIVQRLSGVPRAEVPRECSLVTAGFDAGRGSLHWYVVVGWTGTFGGSIIDYGCWPRQSRSFFAASDARPKLRDFYTGLTDSQLVFRGLTDVTNEVLGRVYKHEQTGGEVRVGRALVDSGYESNAVYQFVRASQFGHILTPSKGIARSRTARGIHEWAPRPGERKGYYWRLTKSETGRGQMVQFDPDAWKTVLFERLTAPMGGKTALTLWGKDRDADRHEMLGEHLAAEWSESVPLRGAVFDKWSKRPDRTDNHLLDCLVMAAVAAGVMGLVPNADPDPVVEPKKPRPRIDVAEAQRQAAARGPVNRA